MKKLVGFVITIISLILITGCTPSNTATLEKLHTFADEFSFDTSLEGDKLNLPQNVEVDELGEVEILFESSNLEVINAQGDVIRQATDQEVTITVTFIFGIVATYRSYVLTVNKAVIYYTVTFNTNTDTTIASQSVGEGALVVRPLDPVSEGFKFIGWLYNDAPFDFDMVVTSNMTLIASWEVLDVVDIEYKLIFETNGGSLIDFVVANENEPFIAPANPVRSGYIFEGWYLESTFDTLYSFDTPATADITIYANWIVEATEDNVIYEHNFTEDAKTSDVLTFDTINNVSSNYETYLYNDLELSLGYKIDGNGKIVFATLEPYVVLRLVMGRRKTGSGGVLEGTSIVKIGSFTHSFTEQFVELEITLNSVGSYTIERESSTSKEFGILFLGLYKESTMINEATVTFDTVGGSKVEPKHVELGGLVIQPNDPTKPNIDFVGWSISATEYVPFDFNTAITEDLILYAFWLELETFIVTVDDETYEVKEGRKLPDITPPFKDGKIFLGWLLNGESFDLDTPIYSDLTLVAEYRDAQQFELTLEIYGASIVGPLVYEYFEYEVITLPVVTKENFYFVGWYIDDSFSTTFTAMKLDHDITLYAKFIDENDPQAQVQYGSYFEAVYATWQDVSASFSKVFYKESTDTNWVAADEQLIRQVTSSTARVDIVGLKAGNYDIRIETSTNNTLNITQVYTARNDRSGYAHFNYTEGIGAYTDEGILKSDAIVVYVTEANKNSITIPGIGQTGLGWILNNNQYFSSSSNTYSSQQQLTSLAFFDKPIVFRFMGKITAPEGLTVYNSTNQGGSIGDNGNMARIRNANNITIEGIGDDAEIYGWGIHLMAMTAGRGIGFEAKNLTFRHYPEDALGLEGVQSGSLLTSPVQRGWIHHVTFYEGYHPNPAESDKSNGDGSLDIKRGEYFTIAYNQFLGAHKTNLVGSSDSSLQYHITYHHNHWQNNASRIPLARQANIHMYNNIFETTDDNTNEVSYAQNTRANAYIFSEANYFIGTKNPSRVDSGAIKSWQDIKYSVYETDGATVVSNRTQDVSSGNKFENFDTNPEVFYYDPVHQRSDVAHLTDAVTARSEVMVYAGHYRTYQTPVKEKITQVTPTILTDSVTLPVSKIYKSTPLLVFQVMAPAEVELIAGSASVPPVLVSIYGEVLIKGSGTVQIQPGIYVIESAQAHGSSKGTSQAKESSAGYIITVDSALQKQARIDHAAALISALPQTMTYTSENEIKLIDALNAYQALMADEKALVNGTLLLQKENTFNLAGQTHIEDLIANIGTVSENSLHVISLARSAYDQANTTIKSLITNYQELMHAEVTFESFKIDAIIQQIDNLFDVFQIGLEAIDEIQDQLMTYELVKQVFDNLLETEKTQVTNSDKLLNGITELNEMKQPHDIINFIEALVIDDITRQNSNIVISNYNAYIALDSKYTLLFSQTQIDKLNNAWTFVESLQGSSFKYIISEDINTDNYFTYVGDNPVVISPMIDVFGYDLQYASKMNSSATITFTTSMPNSTLIVVVRTREIQSGGRLDIHGIIYNLDEIYAVDGLAYIEVTLEQASTYTIKRDNRELVIFYVEVIE